MNHCRAIPGTRRGAFTLMEVLVAAVVLGTGIILAMQSLSISTATAGRVNRLARAERLAASQLARVAVGELRVPSKGQAEVNAVVYTWELAAQARRVDLDLVTCRVTYPTATGQTELRLQRLVRRVPGASP